MKPKAIEQIESILGIALKESPIGQESPLVTLMRYRSHFPKYLLDDQGQTIIGLNLFEIGLTDEQWTTIKAIPGLIEGLQGLNLGDNQLTRFNLMREEEDWSNLRLLDLGNNQIRNFLLHPTMKNLEDINLEDNPIETPNIEVINQGRPAVLNFLNEIQASGLDQVFEVKLLIVGEGQTGKTTLWNLLRDPNHPVPHQQESTIGIQIEEGWNFTHPDMSASQVSVNLWDFGGQEIQYMTHQFFLTRRSFYILLANGRSEVDNFEYWFKVINLLGTNPNTSEQLTVLVVLNEFGNPNARMPYDTLSVEKNYPKLKVIQRRVDFKKKGAALDYLIQTIKEILAREIPHLPIPYPKSWSKVRQELANLRRKGTKHIDSATFEGLCKSAGIAQKVGWKSLSRTLHELGVIIHFQEDPLLADFVILDPQWATDAVYEVMRHKQVKQSQGRFDRQLLRSVWDHAGYTDQDQSRLANLMLKDNFEVCFRTQEGGSEIFIAPQLLPEQRPTNIFNWTPHKSQLRYVYQYPFMPKGIIGRLMVHINEEIEAVEGKKVVWEKGLILNKKEGRALIVEDNHAKGGKQILIEVQGKNGERQRELLRDIRMALDKIHDRSFPNLEVNQFIPCICEECRESTTPFEHEFKKLQNFKEKNKPTVQCDNSTENVPIKGLFEGVFDEKDLHLIEKIKDKNGDMENDSLKKIFVYLTAAVMIIALIFGGIKWLNNPTLSIIAFAFAAVIMAILFVTVLAENGRIGETAFGKALETIFKKVPGIGSIFRNRKKK